MFLLLVVNLLIRDLAMLITGQDKALSERIMLAYFILGIVLYLTTSASDPSVVRLFVAIPTAIWFLLNIFSFSSKYFKK